MLYKFKEGNNATKVVNKTYKGIIWNIQSVSDGFPNFDKETLAWKLPFVSTHMIEAAIECDAFH